MFIYTAITTRDAILWALGMGIAADVFAIAVVVLVLAFVRENKIEKTGDHERSSDDGQRKQR